MTVSDLLRSSLLHVDDLSEACVFALENWEPKGEEMSFLNVGTGIDLTIRELAGLAAEATGYQGKIIWDQSKPDGTPKKQLDVSKLLKQGWKARISLAQGIKSTVAEFTTGLKTEAIRL